MFHPPVAGFLLPGCERKARNVTETAKPGSLLAKIPRGVWVLGFVSMLMDISSELIHALLPVYLVTGLGASVATGGFIDGFAVVTAMATRLFSGMLSDWFRNRKLLAGVGYGLAALSR